MPLLGEIPLLGYLFSHKVLTNRRTSIVVFVTPTLLSGDEAPGPGRALQPGPTLPPFVKDPMPATEWHEEDLPPVERNDDNDKRTIGHGV